MNGTIVALMCPNPKCRTEIVVPYQPNIELMNLTCANCKKSFPFSSYTRIELTKYPMFLPSPGSLKVDGHDRLYPLNPGMNVVGRAAKETAATIQLEDVNRTMSRQHLKILVAKTSKGYVHKVANAENKNSTYLNGVLIEGNDIAILNPGDILRMGDNYVKMVETPSTEENKENK